MQLEMPTSNGPIIDVCINHTWPNQLELMEYMEPGWREYLGRPNALPNGGGLISVSPGNAYRRPGGDKRPESRPSNGQAEGSSYEVLRDQILDKTNVERAILCFDVGAQIPALLHPYVTLELTRAANAWTIDRWLGEDERLFSLMLIPNQLPQESAAEIRKVGKHKKIAGVLLGANGLGKSYGHPAYHPIYEAAAELDLPVVIKSASEVPPDSRTSTAGVGAPATFGEYYALAAQPFMTHITSMISQGVFEKYPNLRVLLLGCGAFWVPAFLWRFDTNFKGLRRDAPWLKSLPSEYFFKHIRIGTNPLDKVDSRKKFRRILNTTTQLKDVLCFASGYPNWDSDDPAMVAEEFPEDWRPGIMKNNASALFKRNSVAASVS